MDNDCIEIMYLFNIRFSKQLNHQELQELFSSSYILL